MVSALGFLVMSYASDAALVGSFRASMWLIDMSRRVFIVGSVALVMMPADRNHAGQVLSLWGVMQVLGQGLGAIGGGVARDIAQQQISSIVLGYTVVYSAALREA